MHVSENIVHLAASPRTDISYYIEMNMESGGDLGLGDPPTPAEARALSPWTGRSIRNESRLPKCCLPSNLDAPEGGSL